MTQPARVKLTSKNLIKLSNVCGDIMDIGKKTGVRIKGPIPLPVKHLNITTRKSPCGSGTTCIETFQEFPEMGRFALRDMGATIAAGVVKEITEK